MPIATAYTTFFADYLKMIERKWTEKGFKNAYITDASSFLQRQVLQILETDKTSTLKQTIEQKMEHAPCTKAFRYARNVHCLVDNHHPMFLHKPQEFQSLLKHWNPKQNKRIRWLVWFLTIWHNQRNVSSSRFSKISRDNQPLPPLLPPKKHELVPNNLAQPKKS